MILICMVMAGTAQNMQIIADVSVTNTRRLDTINFEFKDGKKLTQIVESMQIEHANIDMARAGDEFGLKTSQEVQIGTKITKDK